MEQIELRQWEDKCIQEHAPECTALCPLHVEVRVVLADAARGDFAAALKTLKKRLPFPGIISRICEQPCQKNCKRAEVGDAIAIAALERACVDFGAEPAAGRTPPRRSQRIAVVGGGLSGLTAAFDLARKGYPVTIFEAGARLGGQLWAIPAEKLPPQILQAEIDQVARLGVELRLNTALGRDVSLAQLCAEFKAVYIGLGAQPADTWGLALDEWGRIAVDPLTLAASVANVFVGGCLPSINEYSAIEAMSHGRRAAISIDRYCQNVSLTASRQNEGAYTTRLHTVTGGIAPQPVTPMSAPAGGYSQAEASAEARRCLQCECMECVKVCAYMEQYGSYPKKYAREIYNNLSIVMGTRMSNKFINSCSLCGLCAQVCPTQFDMADLCRQARQTMVIQKRMPASAHDFALQDMQFSNGDRFALARNAPGATTSNLLFFPGCQLSASNPEYVEQIYAYLQHQLPAGTQVGLMLRCCGAPADWAGRADLFQTALAEFEADYEKMGRPRLVLACSSCYQIFKTHLPGVELVSLWELMDQYGLPSPSQPASGPLTTLAVHDPCTARHEPQVQDSVRRILARLGYQLEELPLSRDKTECCSYGGLMWLANRELANKVVERRAAASPRDYVAYCAMCRDFLAGHGKPTWHLLDLIFTPGNASQPNRPGPYYSQRHENRARLKRKLLKEIWGEEMDQQQSAYEAIQLVITTPVAARLEQRLILAEDIQQVIEAAERTGRKLLHPETGHFLAHFRPTSVTYWVEYAPAGSENTFIIHNAYSHRMAVAEETKS